MNIYIPTKGPENKQVTYEWLPEEYRKDVVFLTSNPLGLPCKEEIRLNCGLPSKRQAAINHARNTGEKFLVMVDDDNKFQRYVGGKARKATVEDFKEFFSTAARMFEEDPNIGIISCSGRLFANFADPVENGASNFYILNLERIGSARYYELVFEDVDFLLQVLNQGKRIIKLNILVADNHVNKDLNLCPHREALIHKWESLYPFVELKEGEGPFSLAGKATSKKVRIKWNWTPATHVQLGFDDDSDLHCDQGARE